MRRTLSRTPSVVRPVLPDNQMHQQEPEALSQALLDLGSADIRNGRRPHLSFLNLRLRSNVVAELTVRCSAVSGPLQAVFLEFVGLPAPSPTEGPRNHKEETPNLPALAQMVFCSLALKIEEIGPVTMDDSRAGLLQRFRGIGVSYEVVVKGAWGSKRLLSTVRTTSGGGEASWFCCR